MFSRLVPLNTIPVRVGLLQWYDASQEKLGSGQSINSIKDQSGNGWTLTNPSTAPTFLRAGWNNLPCFHFVGTDPMVAAGAGRIVPLTQFTIFLVSEYSGGRPIGIENPGSGANGLAYFGNNQWVIRDSGNSYDLVDGTAATKAIHCLQLGLGGSATTISSNNEYITTGGGSGSYSDAGVNFTLGGSGSALAGFAGNIAEFISYNRKMCDAERLQIMAYLCTKWRMTNARFPFVGQMRTDPFLSVPPFIGGQVQLPSVVMS